jgi:hypothetical protein
MNTCMILSVKSYLIEKLSRWTGLAIAYSVNATFTNPMDLVKRLGLSVATGTFTQALSSYNPIFANAFASVTPVVIDVSPTFSPTPSPIDPSLLGIKTSASSFVGLNPIAISLITFFVVVFLSLSVYCCCGTAAIRQRNKAYFYTFKPISEEIEGDAVQKGSLYMLGCVASTFPLFLIIPCHHQSNLFFYMVIGKRGTCYH